MKTGFLRGRQARGRGQQRALGAPLPSAGPRPAAELLRCIFRTT